MVSLASATTGFHQLVDSTPNVSEAVGLINYTLMPDGSTQVTNVDITLKIVSALIAETAPNSAPAFLPFPDNRDDEGGGGLLALLSASILQQAAKLAGRPEPVAIEPDKHDLQQATFVDLDKDQKQKNFLENIKNSELVFANTQQDIERIARLIEENPTQLAIKTLVVPQHIEVPLALKGITLTANALFNKYKQITKAEQQREEELTSLNQQIQPIQRELLVRALVQENTTAPTAQPMSNPYFGRGYSAWVDGQSAEKAMGPASKVANIYEAMITGKHGSDQRATEQALPQLTSNTNQKSQPTSEQPFDLSSLELPRVKLSNSEIGIPTARPTALKQGTTTHQLSEQQAIQNLLSSVNNMTELSQAVKAKLTPAAQAIEILATPTALAPGLAARNTALTPEIMQPRIEARNSRMKAFEDMVAGIRDASKNLAAQRAGSTQDSDKLIQLEAALAKIKQPASTTKPLAALNLAA